MVRCRGLHLQVGRSMHTNEPRFLDQIGSHLLEGIVQLSWFHGKVEMLGQTYEGNQNFELT